MSSKINNFLRTLEEYTTLVLSFIIGLFYRSQRLSITDVKRIVIIKLDHIGDVILSIPAIMNLGEYFTDAHITLVVNPVSEPIAKFIPHVDEVICYNARFFDRIYETKSYDTAKGLEFAKNMKSRNFDLIVDLRGSFASIFFALIAKSRYRLDRGTYLIHRKMNRLEFSSQASNTVKYKGDQWTLKHEAEVSLDILAKAGIPVRTKKTSLDLSRISDASIKYNANIVLHPGGPMLLKRWSVDRYIKLTRQLLQRYQARIAFIGGKDESEVVRSIVSAVGDDRVIDLSGKLKLVQLASLLKKTNLFIGNDSGPMHIASACGTKVIGLFGPTDPERFGPYGHNCIALRMEEDCPPCAQDKCKFKDYRCIDRISVEDVMSTVNEIISTKGI